MTTIIEDGLLACEDCTLAIASGEFSGMDDATAAIVRAGAERLAARGHAAIGEEYGFTWRGCDCCQRAMGGDKHELMILGETK